MLESLRAAIALNFFMAMAKLKLFLDICIFILRIYVCHILAVGTSNLFVKKLLPAIGIPVPTGISLIIQLLFEIGLALLLYRFLLNRNAQTALSPDFYRVNAQKLLKAAGIGFLYIFSVLFLLWIVSDNKAIYINPDLRLTLIANGLIIGTRGSLIEELLYRGYYQQFITNRAGPAIAIVSSGLVFGLTHMAGLEDTGHIIAVCSGTAAHGMFYGVIAYYFKSFWYSAVLHYLWNSVFFLDWVYGSCAEPSGEYLFRTYIYCNNPFDLPTTPYLDPYLSIFISVLFSLAVIGYFEKGTKWKAFLSIRGNRP